MFGADDATNQRAPGDAEGAYLFGGIATLLPPATPQATLLAVAGYHIFNGDGTGTDVVTSTINGSILNQNFCRSHKLYRQPGLHGHLHSTLGRTDVNIFVAPHGEN
jgi:hypothetical protein